MPEFILDHGAPKASKLFAGLDSFTQGYIEAMFFTSTGTLDDGDLEHASLDELAPDAWGRIVVECIKWQAENRALLDTAYERDDYSEEQAGRDYWFTRNGHGVGFWDRKQLKADDLGDKLSDAARHSERSIYRGDDGLIYYE